MELEKEIASVLNKYSRENGSNTPDFILAQYLLKCLEAFDETVTARERWYGRELEANRAADMRIKLWGQIYEHASEYEKRGMLVQALREMAGFTEEEIKKMLA